MKFPLLESVMFGYGAAAIFLSEVAKPDDVLSNLELPHSRPPYGAQLT